VTPLRRGVNVDHVATVRNARGGSHPDPLDSALTAIAARGRHHHSMKQLMNGARAA